MRRLPGPLLAIAGVLALRTASQIARELAEYRQSLCRLRTEWTPIRAVASGGTLRIHARVGDRAAAESGPPAVLVHGFGIGTTYFVPLAARLSNAIRVYAPDLPGHGPSDHDVRPLTIPELAEALARWMDAQQLRSALLIGHSLGCQIAAELAAGRPDLVSALVLIGPTSDPDGRTLPRQLARALVTLPFERPGAAIWMCLDYSRAGLRVLAHEARDMIAHRIEDVLPRVHAPAQVIRGGQDRLASAAWTDVVAELIRAFRTITVPGWGHIVHYNDPAAIAAIALNDPPTASSS